MRAISTLAAAAMVISLFLPWLAIAGLGSSFVPYDLVKGLNPDMQAVQDFVDQAPPLLLAFLGTFVLAGLYVLLAVVGLPSRALAFLTGALAVGIVAYGFVQARDGALSTGLPLPQTNDLGEIFNAVSDVLGMGAWAWGVGALLLLLGGLVGVGSQR
jgi:hypothetical protein